MAQFTPLSEVEEVRLSGRTCTFGPCLVWAANWVARNPYPRKFVYKACSICQKSLEFGSKCGHSGRGEPKYRFQVILFDAIHGGCHPLKAQIWDSASVLLNCSPTDFSELDLCAQLTAVQKVFQTSPKIVVWLGVKGLELTIQRFTHVDEAMSIPSQLNCLPQPTSPQPPSSSQGPGTPMRSVKPEASTSKSPISKALVNVLIEALKSVDLEE